MSGSGDFKIYISIEIAEEKYKLFNEGMRVSV